MLVRVLECWVEVVEVVKKGGQFSFCMCPNQEKVINVAFKEKGGMCLCLEEFLECDGHVDVCDGW